MPSLTIGAPTPRNQRTDPESGLRYYAINGQDYVSVTTVRRLAGMPFGLHNWAIGQVIDAAIQNGRVFDTRLRVAYSEGPGRYDAESALIKSELRAAATAERDRAAALGTAVHDAAATGQCLDAVEPELRPRLAQFYDFLETSGCEVIAAEFQVWHDDLRYAGTVDLLVRHRNGSVRIIDIKTGKGVYNDHALQVTAYTRATAAGHDGVEDPALTKLLQQAGAPAILHLADDGWEFLVLKPDDELQAWRAFRGLLAFSSWSHEHSDVDSFIAARRSGSVAAPEAEVTLVPAAEPIDAPGASVAGVVPSAVIAPHVQVTLANGETVTGEIVSNDSRVYAASWDDLTLRDVTPSTSWCRDYQAHQTHHRQVDEQWQCDICIAETALESRALTADEFKANVRDWDPQGRHTSLLMTTARELYPKIGDMRLLDDAQRGELFIALKERVDV